MKHTLCNSIIEKKVDDDVEVSETFPDAIEKWGNFW